MKLRMRMGSNPKLVGIVTCLEVTEGERPTLQEVFRSLASVPPQLAVFVEFEYTRPFTFRVELWAATGVFRVHSESILVLARKSRRYDEIVRFPLRLLRVPPGSYHVVVVIEGKETALGPRTVFFGEM